MNLRTLCAGLALCVTVLTSGCATTSRRYAYPPTVVGYSPVATPCGTPASGVVAYSAPAIAPAPACGVR